jgi:hypothetical protein
MPAVPSTSNVRNTKVLSGLNLLDSRPGLNRASSRMSVTTKSCSGYVDAIAMINPIVTRMDSTSHGLLPSAKSCRLTVTSVLVSTPHAYSSADKA